MEYNNFLYYYYYFFFFWTVDIWENADIELFNIFTEVNKLQYTHEALSNIR